MSEQTTEKVTKQPMDRTKFIVLSLVVTVLGSLFIGTLTSNFTAAVSFLQTLIIAFAAFFAGKALAETKDLEAILRVLKEKEQSK